MEIEYFGANCFRLKTKNTTVIVDDNLSQIGGKSPQNDKTVVFYTNESLRSKQQTDKSKLAIGSAGEFEVGDVTIIGVQARAHIDTEDQESAVVYQFMYSGQTVTLLGHIHPDISAEVAELIGGTDVLIVPVGGNGFTLDPVGASKVIKKVEPEVIIPSQYDVKGLKYDVPAQPLEEFGKLPTVTLEEPQESFKLGKNVDESVATQVRAVTLIVKS